MPVKGRALLFALLFVQCIIGGKFAVAGMPRADSMAERDLSTLLKQQTEAFATASQSGDAAILGRYLDPEVVFTNETGDIATRTDIVEGASPPAPGTVIPHSEILNWSLKRQGNAATATFVDEIKQRFHGQDLVLRFQSTETWARRRDGWKMIASHTMTVQQDPAPITLAAADLDGYVGKYQLDPSYVVQITREGNQLMTSTNDATKLPLQVEIRDVLFIPGQLGRRRLFQRNPQGMITGYISRRNGADLVLTKVT